MTSVANQHQQPQQSDADASPAAAEPPTKKRRGGRRSSNPEISAEERKRLRILKNRESAMRSLAKKAEYSAKLEALEKHAVEEHKSTRDSLEQLLATAITFKDSLYKAPQDHADLIAKAERCITKATTLLSEDQEPDPQPIVPAVATVPPSRPSSSPDEASLQNAAAIAANVTTGEDHVANLSVPVSETPADTSAPEKPAHTSIAENPPDESVAETPAGASVPEAPVDESVADSLAVGEPESISAGTAAGNLEAPASVDADAPEASAEASGEAAAAPVAAMGEEESENK